MFMDNEELGQYPPILTEQDWSIKDLLYGYQKIFSCRTQGVVLSEQDSTIFSAWVAYYSVGFGL